MNQNPQNLAKIKVNRKEMEEGSQTVKKKKKEQVLSPPPRLPG